MRHIDMRHGTAFQCRQYRFITQFGQLGSLRIQHPILLRLCKWPPESASSDRAYFPNRSNC
ncbi:hypothetical protein E2R49_24590 [Salmonella enterica subsp. enterica serovar Minnesota]|nr:hypothetical protein [Salmonella enterica subsp. enterica serovar Minnesota]